MPTLGTSFSTCPRTSLLGGAAGSLSICSIETSADGREGGGRTAEKPEKPVVEGGGEGPSKKYCDRRSARASGVGASAGERNCGLLMRRKARGLKALAVATGSPVDVRGRGRSCGEEVAAVRLGRGMVLIRLKSARCGAGAGESWSCCCDDSGLTGRASVLVCCSCCCVSRSAEAAAPSKPKLKPPNSCSEGRDSRSLPLFSRSSSSPSCRGGLAGLFCSGMDWMSPPSLGDFSVGRTGVVTVRLGLRGLSWEGGLRGGLEGGLAVRGGLMGSVWCLPRWP